PTWVLEAVLLDLLGDQLLELLDIGDFLPLELAPHLLQWRLPLGVGDVLIIAPEGIEAFAQVMDQIVIVVGAAARFADVFQFFFCSQSHDCVSFTEADEMDGSGNVHFLSRSQGISRARLSDWRSSRPGCARALPCAGSHRRPG